MKSQCLRHSSGQKPGFFPHTPFMRRLSSGLLAQGLMSSFAGALRLSISPCYAWVFRGCPIEGCGVVSENSVSPLCPVDMTRDQGLRMRRGITNQNREIHAMAEEMKTYTAKQIAKILQIPVDEVYRMGNDIPGRFKVGRRTRWNSGTVDRWIQGRHKEAA